MQDSIEVQRTLRGCNHVALRSFGEPGIIRVCFCTKYYWYSVIVVLGELLSQLPTYFDFEAIMSPPTEADAPGRNLVRLGLFGHTLSIFSSSPPFLWLD